MTMDDAKAAGLVKPGSGWIGWPARMMLWRAEGFVIDVLFGDVTAGMKRADELWADVTPDGEVIDGSWQAPPPAAEEIPATATMGLQDLLNLGWTAEQIMAANGGKIPATDQEVELVFTALAGSAA